MRRIVLTALAVVSILSFRHSTCFAQTDVTNKYIDNPNFEARFAGWTNENMSFNTSKGFTGQDGMVFMEKWVSGGKTLGSTGGIYQVLEGLQAGTYTLTANAHNIQQSASNAARKGAFLYGGDEQVEVGDNQQYTVVFTTLTGKAEIGFRLKGCTGNWACVDNFQLYFNGIVRDSVNLELQKLITEAESIVGDGVTGTTLQTAIDEAKALLTEDGDYQTAAKALERATLDYRVQNATGTAPKVTTYGFVPTGVTIALGRMTVTGSNIKERGFCWSTEPNPTVLDNRSTRYHINNGNIYVMEHMKPATVYYVRAYAMTNGYNVGYGEVVKIATLPKGSVTTSYDWAAEDEQMNFRIASATNEVQWLYDNLTCIRGFNLKVHFVYNCGDQGRTADCQYGGNMRVSYNTPYQQTGTILHETNHGVGVGTTGEWYNNSNLRANTSRGLWLGPRANQMIQFLENNESAALNGDGTHMWPYGINGSGEDQYNPENTLLYFANAMTTHALHQDGLVCSSSVGFATPAYVFEQDDNRKYYIACENSNITGYLTMNSSGVLQTGNLDMDNLDDFAWHITYDPRTCYYIFQNVGTGKYISYSTTGIKGVKKTSVTTNEKFHLLPARQATTMGQYTGTGYWITRGYDNTLQAGSPNTSKASLDFSNSAKSQRWLFITEEQLSKYDQGATAVSLTKLDNLIASVRQAIDTPHEAKEETADIEAIDNELTAVVSSIETAKADYSTTGDVATGINDIEAAFLTFLSQVKITDVKQPIDITFLLNNAKLDKSSDGWSTSATHNNSCCEFFQKPFDFNQTTTQKMPAGTYELRVQAFQRPGTAEASYTDFVTNGKDNVNAQIYLKTKNQNIKNIWADAQNRSLGGTSVNKNGKYIPDNMLAASKWFADGWYDNSVILKTSTNGTIKLGLRSTSQPTSYWTSFTNFRFYYYGNLAVDYITGIDGVENEESRIKNEVYDLSGRKVSKPTKGLYIINGKKTIIR